MDASPFAAILAVLVERVPGAYAASLVDREGESVDYAGVVNPFDVKVAAAHFRLILQEIERFGHLGAPRSLIVRGERRTIITLQLPDEYALVVLLRRRAGFLSSRRAYAACIRGLAAEAGWTLPPEQAWFPVLVVTNPKRKPVLVNGHPAIVMGTVVGLGRGERGFRVRIADDRELTVVREPGGAWYADEWLPDDAFAARATLPPRGTAG